MMNLTFLLKLISNVVVSQMVHYLEASDRILKPQLGFRKGHSTQRLLLKLTLDVINSYCGMLLAFLDVSVVFEMVNQDTLIKNLSTSYGTDG